MAAQASELFWATYLKGGIVYLIWSEVNGWDATDMLVTLSFVASISQYFWIRRPFRDRHQQLSRRYICGISRNFHAVFRGLSPFKFPKLFVINFLIVALIIFISCISFIASQLISVRILSRSIMLGARPPALSLGLARSFGISYISLLRVTRVGFTVTVAFW